MQELNFSNCLLKTTFENSKILVYIYFGEVTSRRALFCCAVITSGFLLGIQQESAQDGIQIQISRLLTTSMLKTLIFQT